MIKVVGVIKSRKECVVREQQEECGEKSKATSVYCMSACSKCCNRHTPTVAHTPKVAACDSWTANVARMPFLGLILGTYCTLKLLHPSTSYSVRSFINPITQSFTNTNAKSADGKRRLILKRDTGQEKGKG